MTMMRTLPLTMTASSQSSCLHPAGRLDDDADTDAGMRRDAEAAVDRALLRGGGAASKSDDDSAQACQFREDTDFQPGDLGSAPADSAEQLF